MKLFKNFTKIGQVFGRKQLFCSSQFPDLPDREKLPLGEGQNYQSVSTQILKDLSGYQHQQPQSYYMAVEQDKKIYHIYDASRISFGTMCQQIALFIMGKHKPTYRQNYINKDDICIVVNAENILMKGSKKVKKVLRYHTGYVGNLKSIKYTQFMEEKPEQLITWCVNKQMPKNKLREERLKNLKIFRTYETPYKFLPKFALNLETQEEKDLRLYGTLNEMFPINETEILYQSQPMDEFKDYKTNIDSEIEIPFEKRKSQLQFQQSKELKKKLQKVKKLLKRTKIYESKTKNQVARTQDFQYIRYEEQAKKLGIDLEEDQDDIEDESLPQR